MATLQSKGVKKSWEDPEVAKKRATRYWCEVRPVGTQDTPENWTRYSSTKMAYTALNIQDNTASKGRHITFRGEVVEAGELERYGYHWRVILKSAPGEVRAAPKAEPADQLVQFRCTAKEKAAIEQAANGQATGSFVRDTVLAAI